MMITPTEHSHIFIIRHRGLYWSLVGPNGLPETVQGWRVNALQDGIAWSVTTLHARKWDAIAALLRVINKPWTY